MGWFTSAIKGISKVAAPVAKVASLVPGLNTVAAVGSLAATGYSAYKALSGGSGSTAGLPALPALPGGMAMASPIAPGSRSIFRNDPNLPDQLKGYAIPKAALRPFYRAPRGFIVLHDEVGDPYGMPRSIARQLGLWKPAKKPLLSIRDTNAIRHAGRAIKKLQNAEKMAKHIANWHSPRRAAPKQIIIERKGK